MPLWIKVCGITSEADAEAAIASGADALGFMFYAPSPRCVSRSEVRRIVAHLPPFVARVGVFVDATVAEIRRAVAECGLDTLQLHGGESPEFCRQFAPLAVVKAFRVSGPDSLQQLAEYGNLAWLLDSHVAGSMGGTGRTFDWRLAATAVRQGGRVVLAGGLTAANVGQAITTVRPYGVDVSSGVESSPGRKDLEQLRAFMSAARAAADTA